MKLAFSFQNSHSLKTKVVIFYENGIFIMTMLIIILRVIFLNKPKLPFKTSLSVYMTAAMYLVFTALVFLVAFTLLRFPDITAQGVKSGMEICFSSVVPSLYPFMIVSILIAKTPLCTKIAKPFSRLTKLLFKQPACAAGIIIMANIGGYPVGAQMIKQLYESKKISANEGKRLLLFCINPGPAFVLSFIGSALLSSLKAGLIIYISALLSCLILGFLTRFLPEDALKESTAVVASKKAQEQNGSLIACFVESVKEATFCMLGVCSWVTVFSTVSALIGILPISESSKSFLSCILEVTNGCASCIGVLPAAILAGVIGWGGLCVHFQIMPSVCALGLKLKYFFAARILNAAIATVICDCLFKLFPSAVATFASGDTNLSASSAGVPVSIGMFCMCVLLLLGDNFVFGTKKKNFSQISIRK